MAEKQKRIITIGIDASRAFVNDPAGPEYYSWHIIHQLSKIKSSTLEKEFGHKIQFILYTRPDQKPNFVLPHNFKAKQVNMRYLWTQAGLAHEAIRGNIDALFIPAHTLPLLTKLVLPQLPIVVTVHGLEGKYLPQTSKFLSHIYRNWSIGWAVRYSTHLIAVSQDTASDILKTYHIQSKGITVVHEGVDHSRFKNEKNEVRNSNNILKNEVRNTDNILKNKGDLISKQNKYNLKLKSLEGSSDINIGRDAYILFVGTLQPRKNLIRLIQAFSLLKNRRIKLVLAGKYGWLYQGILKAPRRYNTSKRVIFTGRVGEDTLVRLYKGAKVFILPSITEGFGLPILEAQAAGIPVISSYGGALKEVAGEGALFINPRKVEEMAKAIDAVLVNKTLREDLIKKGTKNAKKYSWKSAAYNTLKTIVGTIEK
jgi:glycosyltransferase involved in cell wall biosynthesis